MFWFIFYNAFVIPVAAVVLSIGRLLHPKLRTTIRVRRDWREHWERAVAALPAGHRRVVVHCASVGEWEQARPLIAYLSEHCPKIAILVSFMSPSARSHCTMPPTVAASGLLPLDTRRAALAFFDIVQPHVWIIIRHDLWPNHLWACRKRGIPAIWINANLPASSRRLYPLARQFYAEVLSCFDAILPVSQEGADRIARLSPPAAQQPPTGDTRFDQVYRRSQSPDRDLLDLVRAHTGQRVIIAGSTWPSDDAHLLPALMPLLRSDTSVTAILAPHEPLEEHLRHIEQTCRAQGVRCVRLSALRNEPSDTVQALLVDRIGALATLYHVSEIAFVGGGFGPGVHNVMEPAILGQPVFYGPRHQVSFEAMELVKQGGGRCVHNREEIAQTIQTLLADTTIRERMGASARSFTMQQLGATDTVGRYIAERYLQDDPVSKNHSD